MFVHRSHWVASIRDCNDSKYHKRIVLHCYYDCYIDKWLAINLLKAQDVNINQVNK